MHINRKKDRLNDLKHAEAELVRLVTHDLSYQYGLDEFDRELLVKMIKAKFNRQRQLLEQTDVWKFQ